MEQDLLREFVKEALSEVASDPSKSVKKGLGLVSFDMGAKKSLVLFHVKKAAEAIVSAINDGKTKPDDIEDALESAIVGFILGKQTPSHIPSWGAMMISASAAEKGYGPMMYDIAMDKWNRIMPDRRFVSPSATTVWTYYANSRSDVKRLQFDDVEDPKTPDPQDDAKIHYDDGLEGPLNAAYEGAGVDAKALEQAGHKFFLWAQANKFDINVLKTSLRQAGSGFFRVRYLSA